MSTLIFSRSCAAATGYGVHKIDSAAQANPASKARNAGTKKGRMKRSKNPGPASSAAAMRIKPTPIENMT